MLSSYLDIAQAFKAHYGGAALPITGSRGSAGVPPGHAAGASGTARLCGTSTENTASHATTPSLGKNYFRSPFPAREGREQPDAAVGTGRAGQGHRLDAGLCHGVAGRGPALAMLSPAGGWPRHWKTSSVIFLLLLSRRAAVPPPAMCPSSPGTRPRGDPGSQHTPPRFPPPHPINLLLREKTRPFIFQGR